MTEQRQARDEFATLAGEATGGRLILLSGTAEACAAECDRYVQTLRDLQFRTEDLTRADAFGILGSAQALGRKFEELSMGGAGSGSMRDALGQHIETVQAMADMFRKAGAAYTATEEGNTANIGRST
ncbi:hypothetical protein [Nocardia sp. NPDC057353]|uniref:hypothetical protein n=1 Tax=Nocardia sp. NPDC057353 TaxID=3346104 RepID=UPI00364221CB